MDIVGIKRAELDKTFLISDLHLGHTNIIKYCKRPFNDIEEMNQVLIDNWNETVGDNRVFFLGDMCYGPDGYTPRYWLCFLTGQIHYVKGSHDRGMTLRTRLPRVRVARSVMLLAGGRKLLLIHNPKHVPDYWDNPVIHGHLHDTAPHLNGNGFINVSAEAIGYKPISLKTILEELG